MNTAPLTQFVTSELADQQTRRLVELTRFTRFLTVGALGSFLGFGLLAALKAIGLPTLPANSISFTAGVVNNFTWNSRWTLADRRNGDWRAKFFQFLLVSLV